ncbi:hypothetical protein IWQ62_000526 [Dispira parvispora]|uniref:Uncharacterized protein n=1 Tax=Dispira parvispora TaxID=1520584 RepID=A0A9W8B0H2_9FUNG|nr:hypothetical protein IWQ62_000526 [Dispira parvispora]
MDKSTLTASMVEPTMSLATSLYLKEIPILSPEEFLKSCTQLRDQVQKTKQLVCETVTTHYVDVLNTYLYVTDLRNEVVSLSEQFDQLSHSVQSYGPKDLQQVSTTYPDITAVVDITGLEIEKLDLLSRVHAQLQEVDGLVDLGEFISAATSIAEMHRMLQSAEDINSVNWDESVIQLLCTEFRKKRCLVQCHLDDLFGIGYGFSHKPGQSSSVVRVTATMTATAARTYYDNPVVLGDVLTACDILGQVRPKLEHLVNQLETVCFLPLFQHPWANLEFQSRGSTVTLILHYPDASPGSQGGRGRLSRSTGPSAIAEVLECLKTVTKLCRFIVVHLLQNEWVPPSPSSPTVTEGNPSANEYSQEENDKGTVDPPSPAEPEQIIEDSAVHKVFLSLWWPRFWKLFYDHLLLPIIPEDRSALPSFRQELAPALQRLEKTLKGWRLLPMDQYPLSKFIDSIHASFLRHRRATVLATARDILKSTEMNTTEVTDATERSTFRECYQGKPHESGLGQASDQRNVNDPLGKSQPSGKGEKGGSNVLHEDFRIPTYHITCQTQTLMELVYQTLQQSLSEAHRNGPATYPSGAAATDLACDSRSDDATHDYLVARDLIQLFLALAPIRSQQGFGGEQSFVHVMLLHNDCDYLARHLVVLGKPQKEHWPYPLNQLATFVDLIPSLRNLGQTEFLNALRRRRNMVREALLQHSADNLTQADQDTFYKDKENDIRDALGHLTTWAKASVKFLPTPLHLQSMGLLVGDLVDTFCDWGMSLSVITPFGIRQLLYFIQLIQGELAVPRWWETGRLGDPAFHDITLAKYAPTWPKLAQLTTYLACTEETLVKAIAKLEKAQPTSTTSTSTTYDVLIPDIDVTSYVLREADRCPTWHDKQRPFCIDADTQETVTIGGFLQDFQALAAGWRQRVQLEPGAVVAVISPNSVHYATVMFSVVRAGGTVLLVNPAYTAQEMATQLADAKVSFAVVDQGALPQVLVACQTAGIPLNHVYTFPGQTDRSSGVANIMTLKMDHPLPFSPPPMQQVHNAATYLFYSSGTTGVPKGVMITHRNIVANLCQFRGFQKQHWSEFSGMVLAGVLPFYHTYGTHILLHQSIIQGATVVVMRKFSLERFLASIEKHQVTCALLVPPILLQMAKSSLLDQYNLKSLKYVVTGAAPAPAGLLQQFLERVPVSMYQGYGLTETSPITLFTPRDVILSGSTGVLLPSMEAQIVDAQGTPLGCDVVGELCIRGPHVMSGYLNNPEATTHCIDKQGFLHTGDLAYVNSQGHFYITGRAKEMIKYQGFQVSPVELEALIITHDRVKDVVVIGVYDDERITEVPRACVVCKDQLGSEVTPRGITEKHQELARDILAFVEKRVAYYKRLRGGIAFIDSIPKSPTGKILRHDMVKQMKKTTLPVFYH